MLAQLTSAWYTGRAAQLRAVLASGVFGMFIDVPVCNAWFGRLLPLFTEKLLTAFGLQNMSRHGQIAASVFLSSISFDFFMSSLYFIILGRLSGAYATVSEALDDMKDNLFPVVVEGWKIWPAFTFASIYLLPEALVIPSSNFMGYLFTCYLLISGKIKADDSSGTPEGSHDKDNGDKAKPITNFG